MMHMLFEENPLTSEKTLQNINLKWISHIQVHNDVISIDASELYYRDLNTLLRTVSGNGISKIELTNVYGQRYLGTNLQKPLQINVHGVPGNDLGAFMNGSEVTVHGNVQDGCGNTMNQGLIVVHGRAGDITGHSMRGGKIFIRDDVGFRVGIHMKEYLDKVPVIVVGGTAQDFLGEYMAGGILVVLGRNMGEKPIHQAKFVGTGMHGGVMYIRGDVKSYGKEVDVVKFTKEDRRILHGLIDEFCRHFGCNVSSIMNSSFTKIIPVSYRPYGRLYAY
jgi:glutamate synthase domain-containing protein 3